MKDKQEILFNRQVNYMTIEKLWKFRKKSIDDLYSLLGITKNSYSRIRRADTYNTVNLEKLWNIKDSRLKKLGLSKEIMTGEQMIETGKVGIEEWEEYLRYYCSKLSDEPSEEQRENLKGLKQSVYSQFNRKLKKEFEKLSIDRPVMGNLDRLNYFIETGRPFSSSTRDIEMQNLMVSLNRIDIQMIKACDNKLRKDICKLLKERYDQINTIIQYDELN